MQKKNLTLIQLLVFIFLVAAGGMGYATEKEPVDDKGPEEMILKTAASKKPAKFPHGNHQKAFACGECHHAKTDDGIQFPYEVKMVIKKCVTCHNKDDMPNPKLNSFKLAAHGLCKECHKQNKDSAPTKCSGCHVKK
jgi:cytochrome c553